MGGGCLHDNAEVHDFTDMFHGLSTLFPPENKKNKIKNISILHKHNLFIVKHEDKKEL